MDLGISKLNFLLTPKLDQFACWVKEVNGAFQASTMEEDLCKIKCRIIGAEQSIYLWYVSSVPKLRKEKGEYKSIGFVFVFVLSTIMPIKPFLSDRFPSEGGMIGNCNEVGEIISEHSLLPGIKETGPVGNKMHNRNISCTDQYGCYKIQKSK